MEPPKRRRGLAVVSGGLGNELVLGGSSGSLYRDSSSLLEDLQPGSSGQGGGDSTKSLASLDDVWANISSTQNQPRRRTELRVAIPEELLTQKSVHIHGAKVLGESAEEIARAIELEEIHLSQSYRSLYTFEPNNQFRLWCTRMCTDNRFTHAVNLAVLANSCVIMLQLPRESDNHPLNLLQDRADFVFTVLFAAELAIKVVAHGLVLHPGSYLRDPWNVLDGVIVVLGIVSRAAEGLAGINALRTFRLLKPLRALSSIKKLRILISALLISIGDLGSVVALWTLCVAVFGAVGMQLFMGRLRDHCVAEIWPHRLDENGLDRVCGTSYRCGEGYRCTAEDPLTGALFPNPLQGTASFDNFGRAAIIIFQTFTLEGFMDNMYYTQDVFGWGVAAYWLSVVLFGSFFVASLATAVVSNSFNAATDNIEEKASIVQKSPPTDGEDSPNSDNMLPSPETSPSGDPTSTTPNAPPADTASTVADDDASTTTTAAALSANEGTVDGAVALDIPQPPPMRQISSLPSRHLEYDELVGHSFPDSKPDEVTKESPPKRSSHELVPIRVTGGGGNVDGTQPEEEEKVQASTVESKVNVHTTNEGASRDETAQANNTSGQKRVVINESNNRVEDEGSSVDDETKQENAEFEATFLGICRYLSHNENFSNFILAVIFINSVCLASEHHGMSGDQKSILENSNIVFLTIFAVEAVVRIIGLTPRNYFGDYSNAFDFVIVVVSIAELILPLPPGLSVLRSFRLLRMIRILRQFEGAQMVLRITHMSLPYIGSFAIILTLMLFIFDAFGMTFLGTVDLCSDFHCTIPAGDDLNKTLITVVDTEARCNLAGGSWKCREPMRQSFRNFYWGFLTVFQLITAENWHTVYQGAVSVSNWSIALYFVIVLLAGHYILLNLFLAAVLANVELDFAEKDKQQRKVKRKQMWNRGLEKLSMFLHSRNEGLTSGKPEEHSWWGEREMWSLGLFPPEMPLRAFFINLVNSKKFDLVITGFILISCVAVAIDNPHQPQGDDMKAVLLGFDGVFAIVFIVEAVLKVIALGFWNPRALPGEDEAPLEAVHTEDSHAEDNGAEDKDGTAKRRTSSTPRKSDAFGIPLPSLKRPGYLQDAWNTLDGFIAVVGAITFLADASGGGGASALKPLRVLRVVRALRPLRLMTHAEGLRKVWMTLVSCIPHVSGVITLSGGFCFIYAVLGVHLFMGKFHRCSDDSVLTKAACVGMFKASSGDEEARKWFSPRPNFDNVFEALLTMYELVTGEDWDALMYATVDAYEEGKAPRRDYNPAAALYCVGFILLGTLFVGNLLISSVVSHYLRLRNRGELGLLTEEQEQWVKTHRGLLFERPEFQPKRPPAKRLFGLSAFLYRVVMHPMFDHIIMTMILLNIAVLLSDHNDPSKKFIEVTDGLNLFFTLVFASEMIAKLIALGPVTYLRDTWNRFDGFIVVLGAISQIIGVAMSSSTGNPTAVRILRIFRAMRALRAIKAAKGVRMLVRTFLLSIPSLYNVGTLLILSYFIFAVLGNNLLGGCERTGAIDDRSNFEWFGTSFLLLFRATCGENWNAIMHEYMDSCSSISAPFFAVHTLLSGFIMLNLFIAIILDNFDEAKFAEMGSLDPVLVDLFNNVWREHDPFATETAPTSAVTSILKSLPAPLGLKDAYGHVPSKRVVQNVMRELQIPDHGGVVHYFEVLEVLAFRVCGTKLPKKADLSEKQRSRAKFPSMASLAKSSGEVNVVHAAMVIQAHWRGLKHRRAAKVKRSLVNPDMLHQKSMNYDTNKKPPTRSGSSRSFIYRFRHGSHSEGSSPATSPTSQSFIAMSRGRSKTTGASLPSSPLSSMMRSISLPVDDPREDAI